MQRLASLILPGIACLYCGGAALAASSIDFERYDTNSDGYLAEEEWRDVPQVSKTFDLMDTNRDGRLDEAEVEAGLAGDHDGGRNISSEGDASGSYDSRVQSTTIDSNSPTTQRISAPESQQRNVGLYDTDQDGRISRSEAQIDGELVTHFVIWDSNQDGYLNQQELKTGSRNNGSESPETGRTPARESGSGMQDSRESQDNDRGTDDGDDL